MTALSDRIAAEHAVDITTGLGEQRRCECGHPLGNFVKHIADVTERAVRDTIAQQLENLEHDREAINHSARHGFGTEWAEGHDHAIRKAARIAREGTTP